MLKFAQINLNHCRAATAELMILLESKSYDCAFVQDPYCFNNRIYSCPQSWFTISSINLKSWLIVKNKNLILNPQSSTLSSAIITIHLPENNLTLISQYIPPKEDILNYLSEWSDKIDLENNSKYLIAGDFNARSTMWGYNWEDPRGSILTELLIFKNLNLYNDPESPPSFVKHSGVGWPDLTFGNIPFNNLLDWNVSDDHHLSDHKLISFNLEHKIPTIKSNRYHTKNGNFPKFKKELNTHLLKNNFSLKLDSIENSSDLDHLTTQLQSYFKLAADLSFRKRKINREVKFKWWGPELRTQRNKLSALIRKSKNLKLPEFIRMDAKAAINKQKAIYKRQILNSKRNAWIKFCSIPPTQNTYGSLYKLALSKSFSPPRLLVDFEKNSLLSLQDKMIRLTKFLFPFNIQDLQKPELCFSSDSKKFTKFELFSALKTLNVNKAPGIDNIDIRMLRHFFSSNSTIFLKWVNTCLKFHYFPKPLKLGRVVYFNKSDKDCSDPSAYRPICLLPTLGKLLEKLIYHRLDYHLEFNNLLHPSQFGFRQVQSCDSVLLKITQEIRKNQSQGLFTTLIAADIRGAFDSLNWNQLLKNLNRLNCTKQITYLLSSFLTDRFIQIDWELSSENYQVSKGCPQGSCLGPTLWNILINEVIIKFNNLSSAKLLAFADDLFILTSGQHRRDLDIKVQSSLNILIDLLKIHQLNLSENKTKLITFSNNIRLSKFPSRILTVKLNNTNLKNVNSIKILGITLQRNLRWSEHIRQLKGKVVSLYNSLRRTTTIQWGVYPLAQKLWYSSAIERMILYGSAIWAKELNKTESKQLLKLQRPFLLSIARAYRTSSYDSLFVLTGILPIDIRAKQESEIALQTRLSSSENYQRRKKVIHIPPEERDLSSIVKTNFNSSFLENKNIIKYYTDGSGIDGRKGSAFYIQDSKSTHSFWQGRLNDYNTVYQAEGQALQKALEDILMKNKTSKTVIYTDSLSILLATLNFSQKIEHIQKIQKLILQIMGKKLPLQILWIPAHSNFLGNEIADRLAKKASSLSNISENLPIPISFIKSKAFRTSIQTWQQNWDYSENSRNVYAFIPKVSLTKNYLCCHIGPFLSGHGPFLTYYKRFDIRQSDQCTCGQVGSADHYLFHCPLTKLWHLPPPKNGEDSHNWLEFTLKSRVLREKIDTIFKWLKENSDLI